MPHKSRKRSAGHREESAAPPKAVRREEEAAAAAASDEEVVEEAGPAAAPAPVDEDAAPAVGGAGAEEAAAPATVKHSFFSSATFDSLPLSKPVLDGIAAMGFSTMTRIQEKAIPAVLAGKDVLGAAKYGGVGG